MIKSKWIKKLAVIMLLVSILLHVMGCLKEQNVVNTMESTDENEQFDETEVAKWPTTNWSTSSPKAQGINEEQLNRADKRIRKNHGNIYSLLVIRHGFLVYEQYYNGADKDTYNPVYSVTKSVMSALTGIAIRDNLFTGVDQKISEIIPDYLNNTMDDNKKNITIEHVLTMTGGLETIDNDYGGYFSSQDWLAYALAKPMKDSPGEKFEYNTGLTHALSKMIQEKAKMNAMEYAKEQLFNPMNIQVDYWDCDMTGCYGGGTGLYLTPRDMAKFGYLYLNKGKWDEQQLIPEEWVEASTSMKVNAYDGLDYGYLFWIQPITNKATNKTYDSYRADGAGGQKVVVIPELDTIVVVTADLQKSAKDKADNQQFIEDYVLPAVEE